MERRYGEVEIRSSLADEVQVFLFPQPSSFSSLPLRVLVFHLILHFSLPCSNYTVQLQPSVHYSNFLTARKLQPLDSIPGGQHSGPFILDRHPCRRCLALLLSATKMPPRRRDTSRAGNDDPMSDARVRETTHITLKTRSMQSA